MQDDNRAPPAMPPPGAPLNDPDQREPQNLFEFPLEFRGSAREYFRIWIVNLCLSLLTLGVFSAWAKVRKKRYFYSCIRIDKTPFQYLAEPLPILKGRVIAVVLFAVYWFSSSFYLPAMPWVLGAGLLLAPWVLARSSAFNAHYSAYRNMRFRFAGNYIGAANTLYWLGLIPLFVLGSAFEWWGYWQAAGFLLLFLSLLFPWWLSRIKSFIVRHTSFGGENSVYGARGAQFFKIYFLAGLIVMATVAVGAGLGYGFGRSALDMETQILLFSAPVYVGYVLAFAFVQANIGNLVWNHTQLGPLRFHSTLTGAGMSKLYLSNALGIMVSLGLLIPWAVMRTLKYRADNMRVRVEGDLARLKGGGASAVQAAGAELGEVFDVDLSL